ncbi:MAG: hypothetical protein ABEK01_04465 [Candidatus Nanohaloarchaea archaeon]
MSAVKHALVFLKDRNLTAGPGRAAAALYASVVVAGLRILYSVSSAVFRQIEKRAV